MPDGHKKASKWYKQGQNTEPSGEQEVSTSGLVRTSQKSTNNVSKNKNSQEKEPSKIKSVMFVPHTPGSELAKRLRENEEQLLKLTGSKIKIVERTGTKLQDLLTRANPWKGSDCERENCLLCYTKLRTEKNKTQDCHRRNIVYETNCLECQEREHAEKRTKG